MHKMTLRHFETLSKLKYSALSDNLISIFSTKVFTNASGNVWNHIFQLSAHDILRDNGQIVAGVPCVLFSWFRYSCSLWYQTKKNVLCEFICTLFVSCYSHVIDRVVIYEYACEDETTVNIIVECYADERHLKSKTNTSNVIWMQEN